MEDSMKELSNSLDDHSSFKTNVYRSKYRRNIAWRRHSRIKNIITSPKSSVPKSSTRSEDSDSSFDICINERMDASMSGSCQFSDSDDICKRRYHNFRTKSWEPGMSNFGESDSFNENGSVLRESRNKRKFKKRDFSCGNHIQKYSPKSRHMRNLKSPKVARLLSKPHKLSKLDISQLSTKMENICKEFGNNLLTCGKRKRCTHSKVNDCSGSDCKEFKSIKNKVLGVGRIFIENREMESDCFAKSYEKGGSEFSSSASENGSNDEGREGDDEHSDVGLESKLIVTHLFIEKSVLSSNESGSQMENSELFDELNLPEKKYEPSTINLVNCRQIKTGKRRLLHETLPNPFNSNEYFGSRLFHNENLHFSLFADNSLPLNRSNDRKKRKNVESCSFGHIYKA